MNEGKPPARAGDPFPGIDFTELSHRLLDWFLKNKRDLPWREEHDPYRIWVSEVMLQQTRSESVAPYYLRWIKRFPDLYSLARADQQQVLKMWEGLGYYSRARNLHRASRLIVEQPGGRFPDTERQIRTLPGVGEYTAAAVLSIAFAKPLGVVDGNVLRVLSRLLADGGQPSGNIRSLKQRVRGFVEASFGGFHPGWMNQAWMELGALVCTPVPRCRLCPLAYACRARREHRIGEFPPRPLRPPLPVRSGSLLLLLPPSPPESFLAARGRPPGRMEYRSSETEQIGGLMRRHDLPLLLVRRKSRGLLGGLWEMPNFPERDDALAGSLRRLDIEMLFHTEQEVRHRYSHFEVHFRLLAAVFTKQRPLDSWTEQRWVSTRELDDFPRPKVHIEAMRRFGLLE